MKKKAFISIYVLLLLLILSISVSFIYEQNKNDNDFNKDLYNKKQALYISESVANLAKNDDQVKAYKNNVIEEMKDHYYNILNKGLKDPKFSLSSKTIPIAFDESLYKVSLQYINNKKYIRLKSTVSQGDTIGQTVLDYKVNPIFEFYSKEPIPYDFSKKIDFENISLVENPDFISLDNNVKENFYLLTSDLTIEDLAEDESIGDKDEDEPSQKDDDGKKDDKKLDYKGILYVKGDLVLKTDFDFEGLLIVEGNIRSESDKDKDLPKLKVKGQVLTKNKLDEDILDFTYDIGSYKYIRDIKDLIEIEEISKRTY